MHSGKVASVQPGSIAEEAGIESGDLIISLNGHELSDIIDYRYYSAEEYVEILVRSGDEDMIVSVEKDIDEPLGIEFTEELFDGVRKCDNMCIFCFVHQLPRGMRGPLYLRDDDFRLSFLHGNFVTLTNVGEVDMQRIIEQRLTPLYVSVHTTDPELRREMVGVGDAPNIMRQLKTLSDAGITLHTQIVICPGVNDGDNLDRTVHDLASFHPQVASIGIVPVGLTRHRKTKPDIETIDPSGAREIIHSVKKWQREFKESRETRLVWASDELYLTAGVPVPSAAAYEGYPQIENGIGLVRQFIQDEKRVLRRLPERLPHPVSATIVTSTLAAPILDRFATRLNAVEGLSVRVLSIKNRFFGESVTVAGLITGQDVIEQSINTEPGNVVIVPSIMLRDGAFLDDITIDEVADKLHTRVVPVHPRPSGLLRAILDVR